MNKSQTLTMMIGRFEMPHLGHVAVLKEAFQRSEKVLILVGSAERARSPKNPWTYEERKVMLESIFPHEMESGRLIIRPIEDHPYEIGKWNQLVHEKSQEVLKELCWQKNTPIQLIGHLKDQSSQYLLDFPHWKFIEINHTPMLSASELRDLYFSDEKGSLLLLKAQVPEPVFLMLQAFRAHHPHFPTLKAEWHYYQQYKKQWDNSPYPPIFNTVDAIIECQNHIAIIKRKNHPGKHLWALPGGFVEANESLWQSIRREVEEETGLILPQQRIEPFVVDKPDRSLRGRVISQVFHIQIEQTQFPKLTASDDAESVEWKPLSEIYQGRGRFFEDHFFILEKIFF